MTVKPVTLIAQWPLSRDQAPPRRRERLFEPIRGELPAGSYRRACEACGYHKCPPSCGYAPKPAAAPPKPARFAPGMRVRCVDADDRGGLALAARRLTVGAEYTVSGFDPAMNADIGGLQVVGGSGLHWEATRFVPAEPEAAPVCEAAKAAGLGAHWERDEQDVYGRCDERARIFPNRSGHPHLGWLVNGDLRALSDNWTVYATAREAADAADRALAAHDPNSAAGERGGE